MELKQKPKVKEKMGHNKENDPVRNWTNSKKKKKTQEEKWKKKNKKIQYKRKIETQHTSNKTKLRAQEPKENGIRS